MKKKKGRERGGKRKEEEGKGKLKMSVI